MTLSRRTLTLSLAAVLATTSTHWAIAADIAKPRVKFTTSLGDFVVELDPAKAPKTVENFLQYVADKHYDGTVFHRVIDGFIARPFPWKPRTA